MGLYKLFSCNVEIQYKSCLLSKAMVFTLLTTILNIVLPFLIAYRSRGFWLYSHSFYEQPVIRFPYEYIIVLETDDPSQPIVCREAQVLREEIIVGEENCVQTQAQEYDYNGEGKNDALDFKFHINIPQDRTITSLLVILALDFQLKTVCPLHMQSLVILDKLFTMPPSALNYYGDVELYQVAHLPCLRNIIDTTYNNSILNHIVNSNENTVDLILRKYFQRTTTTQVKTLHSRTQDGHTGSFKLKVHLRIPEMQIRYVPSLLQEFKWAWPQYLSLVIIFYWIFNRIKQFVFNKRLLMAWEVVPWKKNNS